jgi:hypothetical protein
MAIHLAADVALKQPRLCPGEPYGTAENVLASSAAKADAN